MIAHGKYTMRVFDKVLEVTLCDAWNEECANEAIKKFKSEAQRLISEEWACLIILIDWQLATPETENIIREFQKWCIENNQKHEATVLGDEIINAKQEQMNHILQNVTPSIEQKYFSKKSEALLWLASKNYITQ